MPNTSFIIFEKTYLIRKGLTSVIDKIISKESVHQTDNAEDFIRVTSNREFDFIIINPELINHLAIKESIKKNKSASQIIALHGNSASLSTEIEWAESIELNDSQSVIIKKINKLVGNSETKKTKSEIPEGISKRETDVLKYIALGHSNKEIADILFISTHTAVTHRKNITRKLGIKTVPGLTIYAILNNIIDINDTEQA